MRVLDEASPKQESIDYFQFHFTTIFGDLKAVEFPASIWGEMCEGTGVDGSSLGFLTTEQSDMMVRPDTGSYAVLPWDGEEWNLRILDPACGSGVFLVKAFQRLIHRWRRAHDREPLVRDLKPILANNLVGVDRNPEAVRVVGRASPTVFANNIETIRRLTPSVRDPRAGYALVEVDGGEIRAEIRRVGYDVERAAQAVLAAGLPPEFAEALRVAR